MSHIEKETIRRCLEVSQNESDRKLAKDVSAMNATWKVLNVSFEEVIELNKRGGKMNRGQAAMFVARKGLTIAGIGGEVADGKAAEAVRAGTFVAGTGLSTVEMGMAAAKMTSPGQAGTYIFLKSAEKIVSAAGMGNVDKCKHALAALTVSAGANVFVCVSTGGALCILGAASFALEAFNAHAQCKAPPLAQAR